MAALPAYTIRIAVDSFKDKDSRSVYEFPKGSSVINLKAEIEATEDIPVGHQRLVYNDLDLEDNESLDTLIAENPSDTIISLHLPRIYLHLEQRDSTESKPQVKTIHLSPDLAEPIRTSLMWVTGCDEKAIDLSSAKISVLGSSKRPSITISDIDQSLSSYGICNGDTIDIIVYKSRDNPNQSTSSFGDLSPPKKRRRLDDGSSDTNQSIPSSPSQCNLDSKKRRGLSDSPKKSPRKIVRAKYSWDGETMTPAIKGLSLKRDALFAVSELERHSTQPGWLYGSQVSRSESGPFWRALSSKNGYFPENFVSVVVEKAEKLSEAKDSTLEIPPLPLFQFPPASGMEFDMPIGDHGHSFLTLTAEYDCISCPTDPTNVTFKLLCSTHDNRRISSVSIFIKIPESAVLNVQVCKNEAHLKEIQVDRETTENWAREGHLDGVSVGTHGATVSVQAGASKKHTINYTERGSKVCRRFVEAGTKKEGSDKIFWNLKAPMTKLDDEGLTGTESIILALTKKPAKFKYKCLVTHIKDGVKKSTERSNKN